MFLMDYSSTKSKTYGNNVGNGNDGFHFGGVEKLPIVLAAVQDSLDFRAKYGVAKSD